MNYIDVEEARERSGLRLVLTAGVPGPWGEAAKAILHVQGLEYAAVRQVAGERNEALQDWTGQSSAPVAIWNDEPPCSTSRRILWLAERLRPEPRLVPRDAEERVACLGICDEIHGENGLGWCRRLAMLAPLLEGLGDAARDTPLGFMAWKYGYSGEAAAAAEARMIEILDALAARLEQQRARGSRYLIGDSLSAADLYWAAFAAMFAPMPPERCPMSDGMRAMYTVDDGVVAASLRPELLAHRDHVYETYLPLPMSF